MRITTRPGRVITSVYSVYTLYRPWFGGCARTSFSICIPVKRRKLVKASCYAQNPEPFARSYVCGLPCRLRDKAAARPICAPLFPNSAATEHTVLPELCNTNATPFVFRLNSRTSDLRIEFDDSSWNLYLSV